MTPRHDWQTELALVDKLMRAVSLQTDPQELVATYAAGVRELAYMDQLVATSRRGLQPPWYRITRSRRWKEQVNPWEQRDQLPLLSGGILGDWVYADKPMFIEHFEVDESDPAYFHLEGLSAAFVMPQYDGGVALNVAILLWTDASKVDVTRLPNTHWQGNLFGRTTANLVLRKELARAYDELDRELQVVGAMQRSLLPQELPQIAGLSLAADYRTSQRAGGDLYDLFPLPDGQWGLLIADVSGHGTPAAVVMAITHALAHAFPGPAMPPSILLGYLNSKLAMDYTSRTPAFVTAFYGVFDPKTRELRYASAGHPPPRLLRGERVMPLDQARGLPLGIDPTEHYTEFGMNLDSGDLVLLFTDGISEAFDPSNRLFGFNRLDAALLREPQPTPQRAIDNVNAAVDAWAAGRPAADDQTMLAFRVD